MENDPGFAGNEPYYLYHIIFHYTKLNQSLKSTEWNFIF